MKNARIVMARLIVPFALGLLLSQRAFAQTANWIGASGGEWNVPANWDAGVPGPGTNAVLPASTTVNYNLPMAAAGFRTLTLNGALNVNTNGFTLDSGGNVTPITVNSGGNLSVRPNGGLNVTNAGTVTLAIDSFLIVTNGSFTMINSAGTTGMNVGPNGRNNGATVNLYNSSVAFDKTVAIRGGDSGGGLPCSAVNLSGGTFNATGGVQILNVTDDAGTRLVVANGAVANVGALVAQRTSPNGGLLLSNGTVTATSIQIGTGNSRSYSTVYGGTLTNTGLFAISDTTLITASGDRKSQFLVRGGSVVSTSPNGIIIANQSNADSGPSAAGGGLGGVLDVNAGTVTAEKITLIKDTTIVNAYARFSLSGSGIIYLGSGGLVANVGANHTAFSVSLNGGTLAAKADWSSSAPMGVTNTVTFKAADAANTAHNISLSGNLTGTGSLTKTGDGTLTLSGNNSYSGSTALSDGALVLGQANALPKGTPLSMGSSGNAATLDLAGFNAQIGSLGVVGGLSANQLITNSSAINVSTLTFSNSAGNSTFGGVIAGGSRPVALAVAAGGLTLSGQNNYAGNLSISNGRLILSGAGSTFTGSAIALNDSAASLTVSGIGGLNLSAGQSLTGYGAITGNVTAASCVITPGTNGGTGALTISGNLTLNGDATNRFDLLLDPDATNSDQIVVSGALNASSVNVIQFNPLAGSLVEGTYRLIKCGSTGSVSVANFQLTGSPGSTNLLTALNVTASGVDLVVSHVESAERIWVGDGVANLWDHTSTNWLDNGFPNVFTDGNFVLFDDTGSVSPAVTLVGPQAPGSVTVDAAANYTFAGAGRITGPAVLNKTNSGTLTILTTNDFTGPIFVDQGTLQLGNGAAAGSLGTNTVEDQSALVLNLPGNVTFSNYVFGAGRLVQSGPGTLTLSSSNTYGGGTLINAGTLQLGTGGSFGSGSVTNNSVLAFNSSANITIGNAIRGSGAVLLRGSGTVTLTGDNSYGGGTTISNGTLLVNNPAGSGVGSGAVLVAGGTLSGNGTIGGSVTVNSAATFSPGNPIGDLNVSGDFGSSNGAILNFTVGSTSDRALVGGNLTLNGTLNILAGAGYSSGTYTLFNYGGALAIGTLNLVLPANSVASLDTNTAGQVKLVLATVQTNIASFPGALGFGAVATGGRSGSVYFVTNLNDSGPGSFRDAVSANNRTVVFKVGGYINLSSTVLVQDNITIAGQTAPGDGVGVMGREVSFNGGRNVIVRHFRFRQGDFDPDTGKSGINLLDATNIMLDHISIEFAQWNNIDAVGCNNVTVQNSINANPIFQQFGAHTEQLGANYAWCYNLFANGHNRQPMAKINTIYVNNVVYNYQAGYTVSDTSGHFSHDIINNYFITGPATTSPGNDFFQMNANQTIYSSGNLRDSNEDGVLNGSSTTPGGGGPVLTSPWSPLTTNVPTLSTASAFRYAVSAVGALPRDPVDALVVSQVKTLGNGPTGTGANTAGPGGGLYNSQTETGLPNSGYGTINGGLAPADTDNDGMPDYWELALGSNPNVADNNVAGIGGYTKLENYLNWLGDPHAIALQNAFVDVDLWKYTSGFTNVSPAYAVFAATNGTATMLADGHTARFTAAADFSGLGSFKFSVSGNDGTTMTNTVGVLVTGQPLEFDTANVVGGNFVATGSGGIPNTAYYLLAATNVALPSGQWSRLATNQFGPAGEFSVTNVFNLSAPAQFYRLQLP